MIGSARKLILLFLLLFACAVSASGADEPEGAAELLRQNIELYRAGNSEEALTRLRSFVVRNSDSPLLPEAYLYLARIFVDGGQPNEALLYLSNVAEKDLLPEMRLLKGLALVQGGQAASGIGLLVVLEPEKLTAADRRLRLIGMAQGHVALGRPLQALSSLQDAINLPAAPQESLLQQAHSVLRERLTDSELAEAISRFSGTAIGADARLQMAERKLAGGDRLQARQLAGEVVESGILFPYRDAALALLERLRDESDIVRAVGIILPLTGRYAAFGAQVRRGMELAQQVHGGQSVRFLYVDADGDAEKCAQAVTDLVTRERVMAIAGPLTGVAAAAAADRAQEEQVPLLTLSQREGLPEQGSFVFRDSLTPRLQVRALVSHAMAENKITDFAILFPENKMGREMADLFAREVAARGGKITDRQSYAESVTDFRQQVELLQRREPVTVDAAESRGKISFQALFIPDYAERIGVIAPQLVFYGLEGIQLLGINGWNSPELLRLAGKFVEGAVFVDGFYLYSLDPVVSNFVQTFMDAYGEEPGILDAQGFDTAGILLSLLNDPAVKSREALRQALTGLRNYHGVTGTTGFNSEGEAEKNLFLLQVRDGGIVQID